MISSFRKKITINGKDFRNTYVGNLRKISMYIPCLLIIWNYPILFKLKSLRLFKIIHLNYTLNLIIRKDVLHDQTDLFC